MSETKTLTKAVTKPRPAPAPTRLPRDHATAVAEWVAVLDARDELERLLTDAMAGVTDDAAALIFEYLSHIQDELLKVRPRRTPAGR